MAQDTTGHKPQMGTGFYRSTDGSSYTLIADLASVEAPPYERDGSDDTALASTSEVDSPAVFDKITQGKVGMYLQETNLSTFKGDIVNATNPLYAKIVWPATGSETTGPAVTFQYWLKSLAPGKAEKKSTDKVMMDAVLQRKTTPVYVAGS
jgi:hypothetical protein